MTKRVPSRHERAALVGLIAGRAKRLDAERSLDELAGLAQAAGATVVLRVLQERPRADPSTFLGAGKVFTLAAACAEPTPTWSSSTRSSRRRSCDESRKPLTGRSSIAPSSSSTSSPIARVRGGRLRWSSHAEYLLPRLAGPARRCRGLAAASAHAVGRNEARDRPPADQDPHPSGQRSDETVRRRRAPSRAPPQGVVPNRRAGRLHQCGKDDAVQRVDPFGRRASNAVCHVGPPGPPGAHARRPRTARV